MKKLFLKIHRILGSVLSLVFLMWFISGIVMIFSGFPYPKTEQSFKKSKTLNTYKDQILFPVDSTQDLNRLTLEVINNKAFYTTKRNFFYSSKTKIISATTLNPITSFPETELDSMVTSSYQSDIRKKDVLRDFDSWIPWPHFKNYFPIYKYYLNDNNNTQVYVASTTGKVVQESTCKERWLARFGAIPHWFYFKSLRLYQDLWADVVIWISGLGCIMCLTGLIVGIYRLRKWQVIKKKGLLKFSPYKKKWLRWHHVFGMIFGLFVFTFVFSGMLSLADIPQWIVPIDDSINYNKLWNEKISNPENFNLSLSKVLEDEHLDQIKQIEFKKIDNISYYVLYKNYQKPIFINGINSDTVIEKQFSYNDIRNIAAKKFKGLSYEIEALKTSDYYYTLRGDVAAKLTFKDANSTWVYIDSENPSQICSINKSSRIYRWLYNGLHTFSFPKVKEMEWLRITLLIIVSLFGIIVSLSGVVLAYRYFKRNAKKMH